MPLSTTATHASYVGNGVTTVFAYPFRILDAAHLVVSVNNVVQTAGYSVTGVNADNGGAVVFTTAPLPGAAILLYRELPLTQPVDTVNNETILENVIDTGFDRATMQIQQVDNKAGRAFRLSDSDPYGGSFLLPTTENRKGAFLYFDEATGAPQAAQLSEPILINNAAPAIQQFSGTGSQTVFTLSATVPSSLLTWVFISGVYQQKSRYSINAQTLTFVEAPPIGANNIEVVTLPSYAVAGGLAAAGIVDSSVIGRALLVALTQAAARSVLGLGTGDSPTFAALTSGGLTSSGPVHVPAGSAGAPTFAREADTNTGAFFPGPDRVALATGGVQGFEIDASRNMLMDSGYGSVAVAYGVRAWANYNGSGTPAFRAQGNFSSITDDGVGMWRLNFAAAMPDTNYAVVVTANNDNADTPPLVGTTWVRAFYTNPTTSAVAIGTIDATGAAFIDAPAISVAVIR